MLVSRLADNHESGLHSGMLLGPLIQPAPKPAGTKCRIGGPLEGVTRATTKYSGSKIISTTRTFECYLVDFGLPVPHERFWYCLLVPI